MMTKKKQNIMLISCILAIMANIGMTAYNYNTYKEAKEEMKRVDDFANDNKIELELDQHVAKIDMETQQKLMEMHNSPNDTSNIKLKGIHFGAFTKNYLKKHSFTDLESFVYYNHNDMEDIITDKRREGLREIREELLHKLNTKKLDKKEIIFLMNLYEDKHTQETIEETNEQEEHQSNDKSCEYFEENVSEFKL